VLEVRLDTDSTAALSRLRACGVAGDDAFAVGGTVTIPMRGHDAGALLAVAQDQGIAIRATSTRPPTLDDVYLRLTGGTLAA
jgi:hypothetical protein